MNRPMLRPMALAVVVTVLVAGCGGDDDGGGGDGAGAADPLAALATAAEKTSASESYRAEFSMQSDLEGQQVTFIGVGTFSADSSRGRLEGRMDAGRGLMGFEAIALDGVMYIKGDEIPVPSGKEWIKLKDPPTSTLSPSEFAAFLRDSEGVKNVGTEDIRGERATHFRGPLDLEKLAEKSGPDIVERLRRSPEAKDLEFMIDMWVAQDGLPSRITANVSMPGRVRGSMEATSDILEYDVEVDVKKPPADTVASP